MGKADPGIRQSTAHENKRAKKGARNGNRKGKKGDNQRANGGQRDHVKKTKGKTGGKPDPKAKKGKQTRSAKHG